MALVVDHGCRYRQQAREQGRGGFNIGQVDEDGEELVAADARQRIAFTQHLLHVAGQRDQQLVAGFVAILVVDRLETIQIQKSDRHQGLAAPRLQHGLMQTVSE